MALAAAAMMLAAGAHDWAETCVVLAATL